MEKKVENPEKNLQQNLEQEELLLFLMKQKDISLMKKILKKNQIIEKVKKLWVKSQINKKIRRSQIRLGI